MIYINVLIVIFWFVVFYFEFFFLMYYKSFNFDLWVVLGMIGLYEFEINKLVEKEVVENLF